MLVNYPHSPSGAHPPAPLGILFSKDRRGPIRPVYARDMERNMPARELRVCLSLATRLLPVAAGTRLTLDRHRTEHSHGGWSRLPMP